MSGLEKIEIKAKSGDDVRIISDISVVEIFINRGEKTSSFTVSPLGDNIFINKNELNNLNIYSI